MNTVIESTIARPEIVTDSPTPTLQRGFTVTVHSTNKYLGPQAYPGVVLAAFENRAKVRFFRWGWWETCSFDVSNVELCEHEIGACLSCGAIDWYANLSEHDCLCAECQPVIEDVEPVEDMDWLSITAEKLWRAEN